MHHPGDHCDRHLYHRAIEPVVVILLNLYPLPDARTDFALFFRCQVFSIKRVAVGWLPPSYSVTGYSGGN